MIGKTISHYKILEKLGEGGMGVVYKAEDTKLKRTVALKFLPPDLTRDSEVVKRFMNEAQAASALDHPNICTIHEIDETEDGRMFIVMTYYEGETLKKRIEVGPLPIEEAIEIAVQIATGLAKTHSQGIMHRDIKPANIIVTDDGTAKIVDFGLAKIADFKLTKSHTTLGTLAYMSPEQLRGETVDHRTDIWSLGVVSYEMITGKLPFSGESDPVMMYKVLNEEPEPLPDLPKGLPSEFETVVRNCLEKQAADRYENTSELLVDLQQLQEELKTDGLLFRRIVRKRIPRRPLRSLILSGILVLAVLGAILWSILRPGDTPGDGIASIAVMPFAFEGDPDWNWLGRGITDLVSRNLESDPALGVLGDEERVKILKNFGWSASDLSKSQILQFANQANVASVLTGLLTKEGDKLNIRAQFLNTDSPNDEIELGPIEGEINEFNCLADSLSSRLADFLEVETGRASEVQTAADRTESLDALRYFIEGKDAALDLRYDEAIEKLKKAISYDSTYIQAYYWLRWQYSAIGNKQMARTVLAKIKPFISKLSLEKRLEYLKEEAGLDSRWKDYVTYVERLLEIRPFDAYLHFVYGQAQFNFFRRLDTGIPAMEKSVQLDSTYSYAYYILSHAYLAKGDKKAALEMAQKYISQNPVDVNPLESKAYILLNIGRYSEAISLCERILEMEPGSPSAPHSLARAYLALGKYSSTVEIMKEYKKQALNPEFKSTACSLQAQAHFYRGEFSKARELAEQAAAFDSTNLEGLWLGGRILLRLNNQGAFDEQLTGLEDALNKKNSLKDKWLLYHLKGESALQTKDFTLAVEMFRKALNLSPSDRSFYLMALADAFQRSGQFQDAVNEYNLALEVNPNNALANFRLAQTYEELGKAPEARRAYGKVSEIWSGADSDLDLLQIARKRILALEFSAKN